MASGVERPLPQEGVTGAGPRRPTQPYVPWMPSARGFPSLLPVSPSSSSSPSPPQVQTRAQTRARALARTRAQAQSQAQQRQSANQGLFVWGQYPPSNTATNPNTERFGVNNISNNSSGGGGSNGGSGGGAETPAQQQPQPNITIKPNLGGFGSSSSNSSGGGGNGGNGAGAGTLAQQPPSSQISPQPQSRPTFALQPPSSPPNPPSITSTPRRNAPLFNALQSFFNRLDVPSSSSRNQSTFYQRCTGALDQRWQDFITSDDFLAFEEQARAGTLSEAIERAWRMVPVPRSSAELEALMNTFPPQSDTEATLLEHLQQFVEAVESQQLPRNATNLARTGSVLSEIPPRVATSGQGPASTSASGTFSGGASLIPAQAPPPPQSLPMGAPSGINRQSATAVLGSLTSNNNNNNAMTSQRRAQKPSQRQQEEAMAALDEAQAQVRRLMEESVRANDVIVDSVDDAVRSEGFRDQLLTQMTVPSMSVPYGASFRAALNSFGPSSEQAARIVQALNAARASIDIRDPIHENPQQPSPPSQQAQQQQQQQQQHQSQQALGRLTRQQRRSGRQQQRPSQQQPVSPLLFVEIEQGIETFRTIFASAGNIDRTKDGMPPWYPQGYFMSLPPLWSYDLLEPYPGLREGMDQKTWEVYVVDVYFGKKRSLPWPNLDRKNETPFPPLPGAIRRSTFAEFDKFVRQLAGNNVTASNSDHEYSRAMSSSGTQLYYSLFYGLDALRRREALRVADERVNEISAQSTMPRITSDSAGVAMSEDQRRRIIERVTAERERENEAWQTRRREIELGTGERVMDEEAVRIQREDAAMAAARQQGQQQQQQQRQLARSYPLRQRQQQQQQRQRQLALPTPPPSFPPPPPLPPQPPVSTLETSRRTRMYPDRDETEGPHETEFTDPLERDLLRRRTTIRPRRAPELGGEHAMEAARTAFESRPGPDATLPTPSSLGGNGARPNSAYAASAATQRAQRELDAAKQFNALAARDDVLPQPYAGSSVVDLESRDVLPQSERDRASLIRNMRAAFREVGISNQNAREKLLEESRARDARDDATAIVQSADLRADRALVDRSTDDAVRAIEILKGILQDIGDGADRAAQQLGAEEAAQYLEAVAQGVRGRFRPGSPEDMLVTGYITPEGYVYRVMFDKLQRNENGGGAKWRLGAWDHTYNTCATSLRRALSSALAASWRNPSSQIGSGSGNSSSSSSNNNNTTTPSTFNSTVDALMDATYSAFVQCGDIDSATTAESLSDYYARFFGDQAARPVGLGGSVDDLVWGVPMRTTRRTLPGQQPAAQQTLFQQREVPQNPAAAPGSVQTRSQQPQPPPAWIPGRTPGGMTSSAQVEVLARNSRQAQQILPLDYPYSAPPTMPENASLAQINEYYRERNLYNVALALSGNPPNPVTGAIIPWQAPATMQQSMQSAYVPGSYVPPPLSPSSSSSPQQAGSPAPSPSLSPTSSVSSPVISPIPPTPSPVSFPFSPVPPTPSPLPSPTLSPIRPEVQPSSQQQQLSPQPPLQPQLQLQPQSQSQILTQTLFQQSLSPQRSQQQQSPLSPSPLPPPPQRQAPLSPSLSSSPLYPQEPLSKPPALPRRLRASGRPPRQTSGGAPRKQLATRAFREAERARQAQQRQQPSQPQLQLQAQPPSPLRPQETINNETASNENNNVNNNGSATSNKKRKTKASPAASPLPPWNPNIAGTSNISLLRQNMEAATLREPATEEASLSPLSPENQRIHTPMDISESIGRPIVYSSSLSPSPLPLAPQPEQHQQPQPQQLSPPRQQRAEEQPSVPAPAAAPAPAFSSVPAPTIVPPQPNIREISPVVNPFAPSGNRNPLGTNRPRLTNRRVRIFAPSKAGASARNAQGTQEAGFVLQPSTSVPPLQPPLPSNIVQPQSQPVQQPSQQQQQQQQQQPLPQQQTSSAQSQAPQRQQQQQQQQPPVVTAPTTAPTLTETIPRTYDIFKDDAWPILNEDEIASLNRDYGSLRLDRYTNSPAVLYPSPNAGFSGTSFDWRLPSVVQP